MRKCFEKRGQPRGRRERKKNLTQGHKGTKFREDRTKVQNRGMANPLLSRTRTFTCTRPQGVGEGNTTQRHKGTRAQSSEKTELRFRIGDWPFPALFLLITNHKLRITAHRVDWQFSVVFESYPNLNLILPLRFSVLVLNSFPSRLFSSAPTIFKIQICFVSPSNSTI